MSSRTAARIAAFGALLGTTAVLAGVILQGSQGRATTAPQVGVQELADESEAVARELERLRPGRSGRAAQRAVRDAMNATEALQVRIGELGDERTLNALARQLEYLDAVGSVLSNRRSTLGPELAERGLRARAALAAAPGGREAAAATRGWQDLLAFSRRR